MVITRDLINQNIKFEDIKYIITRDLINQNIKFKDIKFDVTKNAKFSKYEYGYDVLCSRIDAYKNLLQHKYKCEVGQRILVGIYPSLEQTAMVFACLELGLSIAIIDYYDMNNSSFKESVISGYVDPKNRLLQPIHFFVMETFDIYSRIKFQRLGEVCDVKIILESEELDYTKNDQILANSETEVMRCTSSGTTGTPKIVTHTHGFMHDLIIRNSTQFAGCIGLDHNLQHGSSFATYYLPILISDKVTELINMSGFKDLNRYNKQHIARIINRSNVDHFMIPYPYMVDETLELLKDIQTNMVVYTLGYIKKEWLEYIKNGNIKNIISIFGSNETSGPIFINTAVPINEFEENRYIKVDDFYDLNFDSDGAISVTLPVYKEKTISTNDKFRQSNGYYYHEGRSDLIRINDFIVDLDKYKTISKSEMDCDMIYDTVKDKIYLAVWKESSSIEEAISKIQQSLKSISDGRHSIDKYKLLDQKEFVRGVKIDHELLRDYFRNYV